MSKYFSIVIILLALSLSIGSCTSKVTDKTAETGTQASLTGDPSDLDIEEANDPTICQDSWTTQ